MEKNLFDKDNANEQQMETANEEFDFQEATKAWGSDIKMGIIKGANAVAAAFKALCHKGEDVARGVKRSVQAITQAIQAEKEICRAYGATTLYQCCKSNKNRKRKMYARVDYDQKTLTFYGRFAFDAENDYFVDKNGQIYTIAWVKDNQVMTVQTKDGTRERCFTVVEYAPQTVDDSDMPTPLPLPENMAAVERENSVAAQLKELESLLTDIQADEALALFHIFKDNIIAKNNDTDFFSKFAQALGKDLAPLADIIIEKTFTD